MSTPEVMAVNEPLTIQSAPKKSKRGLIILVFLLVVILFTSLGIVGYWLLTNSDKNDNESESDNNTEETQNIASDDENTSGDETINTDTPDTIDTETIIDPFKGWSTYNLVTRPNLKAATIKYPTNWTASPVIGGNAGGPVYSETILNNESNNYYIKIMRIAKPDSGNIECSDINEATGKLTWTTKTVDFTKVQTQDEVLYIFKSYDLPDHVLMSACNSKGKTDTNYGYFSIVLPKSYSQAQLDESTKIISSLKLAE
jgi:hypothetical protein